MTSEVLILNKRAVVVGADSAVTTSGGSHPRYSKSATKIFELSRHGNVAAMIFGSAQVDLVPWELAIKSFRAMLGDTQFATVSEYLDELVKYLSGNNNLFPDAVRQKLVEFHFDNAMVEVMKRATRIDGAIVEPASPLADRQIRWAAAAATIRNDLQAKGAQNSLPGGPLQALLADLDPWTARAQGQLQGHSNMDAVDPASLAELAHTFRYVSPEVIHGSTGLVVAGYGTEQIFPAFAQLDVLGHVGDVLCVSNRKSNEVTHWSGSIILPLAQTSMIDVFTDGFGASLWSIIRSTSRQMLDQVVGDFQANGIAIPVALATTVTNAAHEEFMKVWMRKNWEKNYDPLVGVISTLNVEEMAHLAETLLVLESLKERVTSPSESVGGPIDVAAITKSEGLVWIKRKHYFDAGLNLRYAARLQRSLVPSVR